MPKAERVQRNPLYVDLDESHGILRKTKARASSEPKADTENEYIDPKYSKKILRLAEIQREEVELSDGDDDEDGEEMPKFHVRKAEVEQEEDSDDYEDFEDFEAELDDAVDPQDEELFSKYMGDGAADQQEEGVTLADKIMAKIREQQELKNPDRQRELREREEESGVLLPPKVIQVYTTVGELLSRYRSGKLPKAFKIIPSLKNWQDVLFVTGPDNWSPQAIYEATKLFVSNLKANQSQHYLHNFLLERFHEDIAANKTLNYHLYRSLKKSLYKPSAFFKGFLFPLCEEGRCTLREAVIAGSILSKVSVPVLHSAAALMRLADMEYSGPNSLFIKVLLDKKYALPYKVIDAVVYHFMRFKDNDKPLPVIWHQSFLVFAQRYKNDITDDQRDFLLAVLKTQQHPSITPEIRRELLSGHERDGTEKMEQV